MVALGRFINVPRTSFPRSSNGGICDDVFCFFAGDASAESLADCRRVLMTGADGVNSSRAIHSIDMIVLFSSMMHRKYISKKVVGGEVGWGDSAKFVSC